MYMHVILKNYIYYSCAIIIHIHVRVCIISLLVQAHLLVEVCDKQDQLSAEGTVFGEASTQHQRLHYRVQARHGESGVVESILEENERKGKGGEYKVECVHIHEHEHSKTQMLRPHSVMVCTIHVCT